MSETPVFYTVLIIDFVPNAHLINRNWCLYEVIFSILFSSSRQSKTSCFVERIQVPHHLWSTPYCLNKLRIGFGNQLFLVVSCRYNLRSAGKWTATAFCETGLSRISLSCIIPKEIPLYNSYSPSVFPGGAFNYIFF